MVRSATFARRRVGRIAIDGAPSEFRHALGQRHVYGRARVHSVPWLSGAPVVEGVEADDLYQLTVWRTHWGLAQISCVRIDGGEGEIRHATGAYTSRGL
jgi:hypothetical protein